jgi:hypothetical protein
MNPLRLMCPVLAAAILTIAGCYQPAAPDDRDAILQAVAEYESYHGEGRSPQLSQARITTMGDDARAEYPVMYSDRQAARGEIRLELHRFGSHWTVSRQAPAREWWQP